MYDHVHSTSVACDKMLLHSFSSGASESRGPHTPVNCNAQRAIGQYWPELNKKKHRRIFISTKKDKHELDGPLAC